MNGIMSLVMRALLIFFLVSIFPKSSHALELEWSASEQKHPEFGMHIGRITLSGIFEDGDSARFENIIKRGFDANIVFTKVTLYSPGGVAREGVELGRIIRKYRLATVAPMRAYNEEGDGYSTASNDDTWLCPIPGGGEIEPCICASACALAWLGGVERRGDVGLHRSYIPDTSKSMGFDAMEQALGLSYSEIGQYLDEVRVPRFVQDKILRTSSDSLSYVGIRFNPELEYDPIFEEYLDGRCRSILTSEEQALFYKFGYGEKSGLEKEMLEVLLQREQEHRRCETRATFDVRMGAFSD